MGLKKKKPIKYSKPNGKIVMGTCLGKKKVYLQA